MLQLEDVLPIITEEEIANELVVIVKQLMNELDPLTATAFTAILMAQSQSGLKMFWLGYNLHRVQQAHRETQELEKLLKRE